MPRDVQLTVQGMTCGHCLAAVERSLATVPGVADVGVDLEAGTARATVADEVATDALIAAVTAAGYVATEPTSP